LYFTNGTIHTELGYPPFLVSNLSTEPLDEITGEKNALRSKLKQHIKERADPFSLRRAFI
jgi:hypothetical protein